MSAAKKRVVVFISGGGSNMAALIEACRDPAFPAEIVGVIADKPEAGGLAKARAAGIEAVAVPRKGYVDKAAHEAAILEALDRFAPDILCLAGFMRLLSADFIQRFAGRILNIHPALLPLFPGLNTHQRALDAGMRVAGCTVHFVTEGMDEGPIVAQGVVPVLPDDTAETLAHRVIAVEHRIYPLALESLASGRVAMDADGKARFLSGGADANQTLIGC